jgi:hypothetical protein
MATHGAPLYGNRVHRLDNLLDLAPIDVNGAFENQWEEA